ncbi:MAG: hypothetical protein LC802_11620 [Acidobacteria bacterium]|nr:hypothetical protein [Acidobacteriota bacterium]
MGHNFDQSNAEAFVGVLAMLPEAEGLGSPDEAPGTDDDGGADESLEDGALKEREYMRERLRAELKREPTEEELNDWLRRHTEGY